MKVSIRYTVKFEDIKTQVATLLEGDCDELDELIDQMRERSFSIINPAIAMEQNLKALLDAREQLAYFDQRLEDFGNLLLSYKQTKERMQEAAEASLIISDEPNTIPKEET